MHRWQKVLDPNLTKGPWTQQCKLAHILLGDSFGGHLESFLGTVWSAFVYVISQSFLVGNQRCLFVRDSLSWSKTSVNVSLVTRRKAPPWLQPPPKQPQLKQTPMQVAAIAVV
ncbi:Homeodomain-like protein [Raphanus sativus]|nr:Homeodomain-like protein [Raphanus sativus]